MWCFGLLVMYCEAVAPPPAAAAGATFCQVARPHYWTAASTRRDKEQADVHNSRGRVLCGWGRAR
jgi:hypothetical protein